MDDNFHIANCLLLGIGGGTVLPVLKTAYPQCKIIGVEIDPQMVKVAEKFFRLAQIKDLQLVNSDACKWINNAKKKFDLIIIDLFINDLNPYCSRTKSFLSGITKLLNSTGVVIYNSHYQQGKNIEYEQFKILCQKLFKVVKEIHSYPKNKVIFLSNMSLN